MQYQTIQKQDREIYDLIKREEERLATGLSMIPSENIASEAVMSALGSVFTNKYSEGYPYARYYEGQAIVDELEVLCQKRALQLFNADGYGVNVQPYSGSPANLEVYFALLQPGDTVLAMDLSHGVHLTHGASVNFSGKLYNFIHYGFDPKTETIDYDNLERLAMEHKPKMIISGFTAYPRAVDFARIHRIAEGVGAISMADISHIAGLIVAMEHSSPIPFTDVVTMTTHKTLRGPRGAMIFAKDKHMAAINKAVFPGMQGGPHMNAICALAVALKEASGEDFKSYQKQVVLNARVLASKFIENGIKLVSGGTDTHLILIDLRNFGEGRGYLVAKALDACNIYANRNSVFNDTSPFYPSGLRLGTPAITTMGMKEKEMEEIADMIISVVKKYAQIDIGKDKEARKKIISDTILQMQDDALIKEVKEKVINLTAKFKQPTH